MKKLFLVSVLLFFSMGVMAMEPVFNYIDSDWLQPIEQDMSEFWGMAGLQETGMNYYSAASGEPYWKRFNPNNPRYQSWFGVYVVDNFEFISEWDSCGNKENSMRRTIDLTIADQIAWLTYFGSPHPYPSLRENSIIYYKIYDGWYNLHYILDSSSDFGGEFNPYLPMCPDYSIYEGLVNPYQDLVLYCNVRFKYDKTSENFLVIYSAIAKYELKDGTIKYPSFKVLGEIYKMMNNVRFSE